MKESVFRKIRPSAYLATLLLFVFQSLIFFLTKLINMDFHFYDLTMPIDEQIPFLVIFIVPYVLTYFFWGVNYVYLGVLPKKRFYSTIASGVVLVIVSAMFFIFVPTTIVRPDDVGDGVLGWLTRFIYASDSPAVNLFPSLHCLMSWLAFCAMRGQKEIPRRYRIATMIFAVIICLSTQFVKQHYIADLISGILFAEIGFFIVNRTSLYKPFMKFFDAFDTWTQKKVF